MSRWNIAFPLGAAVLFVACWLAFESLRSGPPTPGATPGADPGTDARLAAVERTIEVCLRRIEEIAGSGATSAASAAPSETRTDELDPGRSTGGSSSPLAALVARLDDLELRLECLESDPLARGFRYVESADPKLRRRGIRALKDLAARDPEARDRIRRLLHDEDAKVRAEAIETLADIDDRDAIPLLRQLLDDSEARVRRETIDGLVELEARGAGEHIARLLGDADDKVREDAAQALGKLKSPHGTELLIAALRDDDDDVREEATETLGRTRARDALPALRDLYDSGREKRPLRLAAVIRKLGDPVPLAREVDRMSRVVLEDSDEAARYRAIRSLSDHARAEAQAVFHRAMEDPSERVRKAARKALLEE